MLDSLIRDHWEPLTDGIIKDAIREIPAYGSAMVRTTSVRVTKWLDVLAESVARNQPEILAGYLSSITLQRREEGYAIKDLHAMVYITERHLSRLIDDHVPDQVARNAQHALLNAVMDSARMVLSVAYIFDRNPAAKP